MQYLLKALVIPLVAVAVVAIVVSAVVCDPWSSLLVNLAATLIGSIVTVLYINAVIDRHERAKWSPVDARIQNFVERIANGCITAIRIAVRVGPEFVDFGPTVQMKALERREQMAKVADDFLVAQLDRLHDLDEREWNTLARNLQAMAQEADRIIGLFGSRMEAPLMDRLLELTETAGGFLASYATFPDIYGVAPERLPSKRDGSSSLPTQDALYENAKRDCRILLLRCAGILRSLESS